MIARPIFRSPSVAVGCVASAATTGALVAIGHRAGSSGLPFAASGAVLLHQTPASGAVGLIVIGVIANVVSVFVWSVVCVWLFEHALWRSIPSALVVALAQFVISGFVTRWTGAGIASVLLLGDRLVFAVVLAVSLMVGMRFAFFPREMHDGASARRAHPL